jgi:hypothetical protein
VALGPADTLRLASVGLAVALADLYQGLDWSPDRGAE